MFIFFYKQKSDIFVHTSDSTHSPTKEKEGIHIYIDDKIYGEKNSFNLDKKKHVD
jgi:hypothetical protein